MNGLDWQTIHLPIAQGRNRGGDSRALNSPELAELIDGQFDEEGGIQTRYPYSALGNDILGGGTISGARRIVAYGDELLLFTEDTLYSWNAQLAKWVSKGTHLAVKLTEKNIFATGNEQVDIDRAELDNTIVWTWRESTTIYVAGMDKTTGNVVLSPAALPSAGAPSRPRLVALATKILLFFALDGTGGTTAGLNVRALDPASLTTGIISAPTVVAASSATTLYYDVTRVIGADQAVCVVTLNPTTSYTIATVTAGLTVATSTKARDADHVVAVSSHPAGTHAQVIRTDLTDVVGDYIAISGLADVYTAQAVGTYSATLGKTQITAAHRSTTNGGQYRCYVFWSDERSNDGAGMSFVSKSNWVDTGNNLGTQGNFVRRLDIGSRAFDHDGRVYVWTIWALAAGSYGWGGQLQNASFLYRDDAFLVAKSAWNRGAGFLTAGLLPGVASTATNTYSYAGSERAVFGELTSSNFTGKRPRDVVFTFDSNEARRTARLGNTLYIACGEGLLQYDGQRLTEVGFHVWPWYFVLSTGAGGSVENGTYGYKTSYVSQNAQAERDRSAAIRVETQLVSTAPDRITVADIVPLYITHKPTLAVEVWRTKKDPNIDDPYYLASTSDPSDTSNPQRYMPNDTTVSDLSDFHDELADADLAEFGSFPQDNTLPNLAPPAASIILATDTRLFLAGVAGDPNGVWYSKQRADGEIAAFHGALVAQVPPAGGDITALAFLNETLVVFRETAIYLLPGEGFDNVGGGQNYGPARTVSLDVGAVSQESVAVTDKGLVFESSKGWYLLNRGYGIDYIGNQVSDFDDEEPLSIDVVESQHQVRILTSARMLVFDTLIGQWAQWSIADGVHACMWRGAHVYLTSTGPKQQQTTHDETDYGLDVETAWVKMTDLQGFGRVRWLEVLGEFCSAHRLRIRLARDYWKDGADTYFDDQEWGPNATTAGEPLQVRHGPSIQQVQALKVRLTAVHADGSGNSPEGEALKLTGIGLEVGFKRGLFRHLPAAQKQ